MGVRRWQIPLCMCEGGEFTTGQGEVVTTLVRCEEVVTSGVGVLHPWVGVRAVVTSGVGVREVVRLGWFEGGGNTPGKV